MAELLWNLDDHLAHLRTGPLRATIDLWQPQRGLTEIACRSARLADARLLALEPADMPGCDFGPLAERYVRGADLVAVYEATATRPVRVDAMWRAVAPSAAVPFLAAVELIVSVRTHVLDARPDLHVQSVVPADEVLRLTAAGGFVGQRFLLPGERPIVLEPRDRPGCLLLRLPGSELSYAEMIHPVDFQRDELFGSPGGDRLMRLRHGLFASPLEKGVMLRARVRGALLPRRQDEAVAAECYAAFTATEPPLGA